MVYSLRLACLIYYTWCEFLLLGYIFLDFLNLFICQRLLFVVVHLYLLKLFLLSFLAKLNKRGALMLQREIDSTLFKLFAH